MDYVVYIINIIMHLGQYIELCAENLGYFGYLIPFVIILCETGLVVTPFLPGDSLVFTLGAVAASGSMHIEILVPLILLAAILGDSLNYKIGSHLGPKVFENNHRFLKHEHLIKAQQFFDEHGSQAIILARFIPIVRTMVPFVAGVGTMNYRRFIHNNIIGGLIWTIIFVLGGYYFGNLPVVQNNFSVLLVLIILVSVLPVLIPYFKRTRVPAVHSA